MGLGGFLKSNFYKNQEATEKYLFVVNKGQFLYIW